MLDIINRCLFKEMGTYVKEVVQQEWLQQKHISTARILQSYHDYTSNHNQIIYKQELKHNKQTKIKDIP